MLETREREEGIERFEAELLALRGGRWGIRKLLNWIYWYILLVVAEVARFRAELRFPVGFGGSDQFLLF